ncbi:MAG TPA: polysaccharide pyruvyl transferase family protein [Crinalium sp.]|jgi:colanic acid/amylovoran biosynthesis protein
MKAVITGITGLRNRGVEALVVPTVEQLLQRQPSLAINVLTKTVDYDTTRLQHYGVDLIEVPVNSGRGSRWRRLKAKLPFQKSAPSKLDVINQAIRESSVVVASGGDVFSSDYGALHRHLQPLEVALNADVPVVFLAQSIGPFKTDAEAKAWTEVARRSKLVTVREKISYDYVTKTLGLPEYMVKLTADPAFLLQPPSREQVARMMSAYGITRDRPVIAIAVSQGISRFSGCDYTQQLNAWKQVVKLLLDEFDAQVLIIPHVQEIYVGNDDRIAATNLLKSLNFHPRVHLVGADHTASEFKGLIGACDMVIAERMHACIAGLSSGICTVAVGYSIKAEGILNDLMGAEAVQNGLLIPIQQFLDADKATDSIRSAWKNRDAVASQLQSVLPSVKQNSASNFDMISAILS